MSICHGARQVAKLYHIGPLFGNIVLVFYIICALFGCSLLWNLIFEQFGVYVYQQVYFFPIIFATTFHPSFGVFDAAKQYRYLYSSVCFML